MYLLFKYLLLTNVTEENLLQINLATAENTSLYFIYNEV